MNNLLYEVINSTISFPQLVKEMNSYNKEEHSYEKKVKVAVVGSSSIQYLTSILRFNLNLRGFEVDIYEGEYDGINSNLFNLDSELVSFSPQFVLILPHYTDIKSLPPLFCKSEDYPSYIESVMRKQQTIWNNVATIPNVHIFQCNYVIPYIEELGSFEANTVNSKNSFLREINRAMLIQRPSYVSIVDLEAMASSLLTAVNASITNIERGNYCQ